MRAIALDPGAAAPHERLVSLLLWTGRPADALAQAERGVELDPLAPEAHAELARALMGNDRCDEALAELDKLSRLQTPLQRVVPMAAECYGRERRWSEAIAVLRPRAERGDAPPLALLGFMLGRSGQREQAQDGSSNSARALAARRGRRLLDRGRLRRPRRPRAGVRVVRAVRHRSFLHPRAGRCPRHRHRPLVRRRSPPALLRQGAQATFTSPALGHHLCHVLRSLRCATGGSGRDDRGYVAGADGRRPGTRCDDGGDPRNCSRQPRADDRRASIRTPRGDRILSSRFARPLANFSCRASSPEARTPSPSARSALSLSGRADVYVELGALRELTTSCSSRSPRNWTRCVINIAADSEALGTRGAGVASDLRRAARSHARAESRSL